MKELKGVITFKGSPLTLSGENFVEVGDVAPDFTAYDTNLNPVKLSDFRGKKVIISSVPSLDTSVCDIETKKFNDIAKKLDPNVVILTISMDLPFAQKRWCGANDVQNVKTVSDYKDREFATKYGVYINELGLLARVVFVVDENGKVKYKQVVKEVASEPDYDDVLKNL
ncbi:MAG: thiol peroxidase [Spirochaetia bacterium]|nr:thiol peroxidase [Spirochaetota bacterium]MCX8095961.1 thiol peroxidase [Spirochaetota bacterium]MDW8113247.1 thiol peroxidase [Spirochaetia bacterium]